MRVFFDTSAFAKRYVKEPGTLRVMEICSAADSLGLAAIYLPEMVSVLNRLIREGKLAEDEYCGVRETVLADIEDADICELTPRAISHSLRCLEKNALRALDAIHLGCALAYGPDLFVSSDRRQVKAARKEGLKVLEI
jgi:predicted nucleic acid-binding protein